MPPKKNIPKEKLEKLYYKEQMSSRQIASHLGLAKSTILKKLKDFGILVRSSRDAWILRWKKDKNFREKIRRIARKNLPKGGVKGRIPWNKGIPRSEKTRRRISIKTKGRIPWNKGVTKDTAASLQRMAEKFSMLRRGENNPNWGNGKRPLKDKLFELYLKERKTREEIAHMFRVKRTTVDKWLKRYGIILPYDERRERQSLIKKPTSIEREFIELCKENGLPFSYVGNGRFWIGRCNPDFVNIENRWIIEVLGSYWHNEEEVKERAEYFRRKNYMCLMIWDYEFENPELIVNKVRRLMNAHIICETRLG